MSIYEKKKNIFDFEFEFKFKINMFLVYYVLDQG